MIVLKIISVIIDSGGSPPVVINGSPTETETETETEIEADESHSSASSFEEILSPDPVKEDKV